jgi:glutathione peroxidase
LTPQYEGLQRLYEKYKDRGFTIVAFPCNQFGAQEPGTEEQIESTTCSRFKVSFPMMAKVDVNGDTAAPVYKYLKSARPGFLGMERIAWNFGKFAISKSGEVVGRYAPTTKPEDLEADIERFLAQ